MIFSSVDESQYNCAVKSVFEIQRHLIDDINDMKSLFTNVKVIINMIQNWWRETVTIELKHSDLEYKVK